jgi:hypothetical protein
MINDAMTRRREPNRALTGPGGGGIRAAAVGARVGLTLLVLTGCRSSVFTSATLPEPRDPDAKEIVRARDGQVEVRVFDRAMLQFQRDDPTFTRIVAGLGWERVRLERRFSNKDDEPRVVVYAVAVKDDAGTQPDGNWIRYERRIGAGTVDVQRGDGKPPDALAASTIAKRWVRNVWLAELTIPNRPFPN